MKDLSIFFKHDDVARIIEHVKSVLEASVDYCYPNHPEPKAEPGDMGEVSDGYHTFNELYRYRMLYNAAFFNLLARNGQVIQTAASYIFRSSFVSEDQARKAMVKAGNNATKILVKTFRGKLFKKAFERARRGKDISSFERQEKESGFNFLHNPNNGRMQSGHIIIDGIGLFKQIIHER